MIYEELECIDHGYVDPDTLEPIEDIAGLTNQPGQRFIHQGCVYPDTSSVNVIFRAENAGAHKILIGYEAGGPIGGDVISDIATKLVDDYHWKASTIVTAYGYPFRDEDEMNKMGGLMGDYARLCYERDNKLHRSQWLALRHAEELELDLTTSLTAAEYTELLEWRQALRECDDSAGGDPDAWVWPNEPSFIIYSPEFIE